MKNILERYYKKDVYESFICIAILTFIGGFLNAYTYELHEGYLASMNSGNMARIAIAFAEGWDMTKTIPYFTSIFANSFGAMTAYICSKTIAKRLKIRWKKLCLIMEMCFFFVIGLFPGVHHMVVNFCISFTTGFQLGAFTVWDGNTVATTIASGNIRFVGEHLGEAILNPNWKNIVRFVLFTMITFSFLLGVFVGADICMFWGRRSIFLICLVILIILLVEAETTRRLEEQSL